MSSQNVLFIGFVWPEPQSSAAGTRTLQLVELFRSCGFQIIFSSAAARTPYQFKFSKHIILENVELNSESFDDFISKLKPAIVVFDRFMVEEQFGWRVAKFSPDSVRILDLQDLHSLREARRNALTPNQINTHANLLEEPLALREIASILRSDHTFVISKIEFHLLRSVFDISERLITYLPLFVNTASECPGYRMRANFTFIGNFLHKPNEDAVVYLRNQIWPLILNELPSSSCEIYGSYVTGKIKNLHEPTLNFFIRGRAVSSEHVIKNAKIMLAPLRFGAGLKGKLLEAMACGTPWVTTGIGAEGICAGNFWNDQIADDPSTFAAAAVALYQSGSKWEMASARGLETVTNEFQMDGFKGAFSGLLRRLTSDLQKLRAENFTGRMLHFHMVRSTEYLSRWIEAKNR